MRWTAALPKFIDGEYLPDYSIKLAPTDDTKSEASSDLPTSPATVTSEESSQIIQGHSDSNWHRQKLM